MAITPEKEKKEKILAVVLLVILGIAILYNVQRHKKIQSRRMRTKSAPSAPVRPSPSSEIPPPTPPESAKGPEEASPKLEALEWKRDPFLYGMSHGGKVPTLQLSLSGIIYDEVRPEATYAIINEDVVRIGDNLHGIKVIDIQPDFVRLKKFNQDVFLYLHEGEE